MSNEFLRAVIVRAGRADPEHGVGPLRIVSAPVVGEDRWSRVGGGQDALGWDDAAE